MSEIFDYKDIDIDTLADIGGIGITNPPALPVDVKVPREVNEPNESEARRELRLDAEARFRDGLQDWMHEDNEALWDNLGDEENNGGDSRISVESIHV